MVLQFADDRTQPITLILDASELRGMTHALGDEQRAERVGIGGEINGVERHVTRCSALGMRRQSFARVGRRRESPCRSLLRRVGRSDAAQTQCLQR